MRALLSHRIIVGRLGPGIRIAPHRHNAVADVERVVRAMAAVD